MGDGVMGDGVMGDGVMEDVMGDDVMGDGVMGDARKFGGEKLEEWCKEYGQLAEASEEGLGFKKGAVVPIMTTMILKF